MNSSPKREQLELGRDKVADLPTRWKKLDIISKVFLGFVGITVTFFIQYQQWQMAKGIEKTNREFETSRIMISQGQLASTLVENIIKGNEKEKRLALAILETTTKDMFPRILDALAVRAPDESTRMQAIQDLGQNGDLKSAKRLFEITISPAPKDEREAALAAQMQIQVRLLNTARAYFETGLYQSAAEEFKKIENLLTSSEVNQSELELAKVAYSVRDYKSATEHYIEATKRFINSK